MKKIFTSFAIVASIFTMAQNRTTNNFVIENNELAKLKTTDLNGNTISLNTSSNESRELTNRFFGFEASESFNLGDVNGQNGWYVTATGETTFVTSQNVVNTSAYAGTQSLSLKKDIRYAQQSNPIVGAYYSGGAGTYSYETLVKFDFSDGTSSYQFGSIGNDDYFSGYFRTYIQPTGNILAVADFSLGQMIGVAALQPNQWYKLKIKYVLEQDPEYGDAYFIEYYVDDELMHVFDYPTDEETPADYRILDRAGITHNNSTVSTQLLADNFSVNEGNLATSQVNKKMEISVYPNPTSNYINIKNNAGEKVESITIGDLTGRVVKQVNAKDTKIDIQTLPAGIYTLKIKTDRGLKIEKIIKK